MIVILHPHRHGQMFACGLPNGMRLKPMKVPIFGAARALLALGFTPDTLLEFRHVGSDIIAASGIVGDLAKWTIEETDKSSLHKRRWRPFGDAASSLAEDARTAAEPEAGYLLPAAGERVLEADAA